MNKRLASFFFILLVGWLSGTYMRAQGLDLLAGKTAQNIVDFLANQNRHNAAIIKFENFSELSDQSALKFYQLLLSKLEGQTQIPFVDLMINFSNGRGVFNRNVGRHIHYPIYVKIIRNRGKIGVGTVIFSTLLDRIVSIKYAEEWIDSGEKEILNTAVYGFEGVGFSRTVEIEADQDLLDLQGSKAPGGEYRFYFYYPEKVDIYGLEQNRLQKLLSLNLEWGRPYYPAQQLEGRLLVFDFSGIYYLAVGSNFSPRARLFSLKNNQWRELASIPFTPFELVQLNGIYYLIGASYEMGKNYFRDKVFLAPFANSGVVGDRLYEKKVDPFYAVDFSIDDDILSSIHIVDKDYHYKLYTADFESFSIDVEKRGSALASLEDQWLAVSEYVDTGDRDKLFFYKIESGGRRLVYEESVSGAVVFISTGMWKQEAGFWVYVKRRQKYADEYRLQFWKKSKDEAAVSNSEIEGGY
jgi:hypothetical protein